MVFAMDVESYGAQALEPQTKLESVFYLFKTHQPILASWCNIQKNFLFHFIFMSSENLGNMPIWLKDKVLWNHQGGLQRRCVNYTTHSHSPPPAYKSEDSFTMSLLSQAHWGSSVCYMLISQVFHKCGCLKVQWYSLLPFYVFTMQNTIRCCGLNTWQKTWNEYIYFYLYSAKFACSVYWTEDWSHNRRHIFRMVHYSVQ